MFGIRKRTFHGQSKGKIRQRDLAKKDNNIKMDHKEMEYADAERYVKQASIKLTYISSLPPSPPSVLSNNL
jgi:hypothetical protein